ncbi:hypothetical protein PISMIDRAFT_115335 [Pisolithus microcarpus 441]|uniref:Anaphase-promoting complex subunit 4-like WD40 domain-containing protein n=1 Tax=Pisolithus microcarpus 441 TaxID=765257 RepID=A0A0C9XSN4_9AGAM|nr:hypothetical protein PISMIDRAFT_115335 [Pisolithus microcarpus 441]
MRGSTDIVLSIAVSQDGRWIVSGDDGDKATVWNADTHEKVREFRELNGSVFAVDISNDGTKVVAGDNNAAGTARIFGTTSGIPLLPPLPHSHVRGVKFSPDGHRLATASQNCGFRIYSTHNGSRIGGIITHAGEIRCIALSPSGGYLACGFGRDVSVHNLRGVLPSKYFDHDVSVPSLHHVRL